MKVYTFGRNLQKGQDFLKGLRGYEIKEDNTWQLQGVTPTATLVDMIQPAPAYTLKISGQHHNAEVGEP